MHLLRKELKMKIYDFGRMGILNSSIREHHKFLLDFLYEGVVQARVEFKGFRYR